MKNPVLDTTLKRLLSENYSMTKAYYLTKLYYYNFVRNSISKNNQTVIVYQMGKVGSTTVFDSLQALKSLDVYHVHALTKSGVESIDKYYKNIFHRMRMIPAHLLESQYLRQQLNSGLKGEKKCKVVTVIREPIAKNISSFFQKLESFLGYEYKKQIEYMEIEDIVVELRELFLQKFDRHERPLTWFDNQFKPVFDVDVFSSDFNKTKGYKIYDADYADLLVIRLEDLNECVGEALKKLLGINEFTLAKSNVGGNKSYGSIYRKFLESISLPESYIERMYASKYARHFYSEQEIEAFKAKWRKQNPT